MERSPTTRVEIDQVPLLTANNLHKRFEQTTAVAGVSLQIEPGEILGFLGPNGAGKTTTLNMLAGLLTPDQGEIRFVRDGSVPQDLTYRRRIGVVPQHLAIYPELSAQENLLFFARLYRIPRELRPARIEAALELTGLQPRRNDRVADYSGGMMRRLNFGIALLHEPDLLILDEPTVGVDPQSRAHLLNETRKLRDKGVCVIYASHYMEEVQSICDRVAIIDNGQVVTEGSLQSLLKGATGETIVMLNTWLPELETRIPAPGQCYQQETGEVRIEIPNRADDATDHHTHVLEQILHLANTNGVRVTNIRTEAPNLESLFLKLTGKALRD